ncbi:MAG: hypothetical protein KAX42_03270, partial [Sphaerotilus sp.]|nr:hypothetical protein [Sphaerotilus sp.]
MSGKSSTDRLASSMNSRRNRAAVVGRPLCGLLAAAATGVFAQTNNVPYGVGGSGLTIRDVAARKNLEQEGRSFWLIPT